MSTHHGVVNQMMAACGCGWRYEATSPRQAGDALTDHHHQVAFRDAMRARRAATTEQEQT